MNFIIKIFILCLLTAAIPKSETKSLPVLLSHSSPKHPQTAVFNTGDDNLSIGLVNKRIKRGLKSSSSGLANYGGKPPPPPIFQRPRANSAVLPSTSSVGLFGTQNKLSILQRPRSNSLTPSTSTGFGSRNNQFSTKPLYGSSSGNISPLNLGSPALSPVSSQRTSLLPSNSLSPLLPSTRTNQFSPKPLYGSYRGSRSSSTGDSSPFNLGSPAISAASSRRSSVSSFGEDERVNRFRKPLKSKEQFNDMSDPQWTWQQHPVNSKKLTENCYFCTAAGLSGRTTNGLEKKTGIQEKSYGSIPDVHDLLKPTYPKVRTTAFESNRKLDDHLRLEITPGTSQAFGVGYLNPPVPGQGRTGHMIAMNAGVAPDGTLLKRKVDFQMSPKTRMEDAKDKFSPHVSPGSNIFLTELSP